MDLKQTAKKIIDATKLDDAQTFTLVYDNSTLDFAKQLILYTNKLLINKKLNEFICYNLDECGLRPLKGLPNEIYESASNSDLVFLIIKKRQQKIGEYKTVRKPLMEITKTRGARLGCIYDVPSKTFPEIFQYDFEELKQFNQKLFNLLKGKHQVTIKTDAGTNISIQLTTKYTLINQDADLSTPSPQHSLLGGEVYGLPTKIEGTLVVNGVIGGPFSKFDVEKEPLTIQIKKNKIISFYSKNKDLQNKFKKYLNKYDNFNRVGELGFGTNKTLKKFYHILGIDEKYPGNHIAFGNPYPNRTGAKWKCKVHVDCVIKRANTWIDNQQIIKDGKYLI